MIEILRAYFGSSVSTDTLELTAAVLCVAFVLLICSMTVGILNKFFR